MNKTILVAIAGMFLAAGWYSTVGAQGTASVVQGVYTAEQAMRGEPLYAEQCAACHGDDLMGSGPMPPLAGMDFLANWEGKTVGELFEKTFTTMPANAPGTLTEQQTADILSFMLQASKFPTGMTELAPMKDALDQIKIELPAAAQ